MSKDTRAFLYGLALLLIGLKLTGHVAFSWWIVTAPLWVLPALKFVISVAVGFITGWNRSRKKHAN